MKHRPRRLVSADAELSLEVEGAVTIPAFHDQPTGMEPLEQPHPGAVEDRPGSHRELPVAARAAPEVAPVLPAALTPRRADEAVRPAQLLHERDRQLLGAELPPVLLLVPGKVDPASQPPPIRRRVGDRHGLAFYLGSEADRPARRVVAWPGCARTMWSSCWRRCRRWFRGLGRRPQGRTGPRRCPRALSPQRRLCAGRAASRPGLRGASGVGGPQRRQRGLHRAAAVGEKGGQPRLRSRRHRRSSEPSAATAWRRSSCSRSRAALVWASSWG